MMKNFCLCTSSHENQGLFHSLFSYLCCWYFQDDSSKESISNISGSNTSGVIFLGALQIFSQLKW